MVAPITQPQLAKILFRSHAPNIAFSFDIIMIYQQILVNPSHQQILVNPSQQNLHLIVRRFDEHSPIEDYVSNIITDGTGLLLTPQPNV